MHEYWLSVAVPAPEGIRLLFYSPDRDFIFVGITRDGIWFDEAEFIPGEGAQPVPGVTHWRLMPEKPWKQTSMRIH
jgi:hypothetical protein